MPGCRSPRSSRSPVSRSASTAGSRPCTRRSTAGCWPTPGCPSHVQQIADLGIEPFDLVVVNLYPFRETVAAGRIVRRMRRADRHRRSGDDPGVGEEPPVGGGGGRPVDAIRRSRTPSPQAVSPSGERTALAAAAFAHTAAYDVAVASYLSGAVSPDDGWPRMDRRHLGEGVVTALRREPAPAGSALPALATGPGVGGTVARQGDELQQLRRRRCGVARGRATSPTPRWRSSSTPTPVASRPIAGGSDDDSRAGPPAGARLRSGVGVRRGHRRQPAGDRRRWPNRLPRSSPKSLLAPGILGRGAGHPDQEEEHPAAGDAGRLRAGPGRVQGHLRRAAGADAGPGRRPWR